MKLNILKNRKKIIIICIAMLFISQISFAQSFPYNPYGNTDYYHLGMTSMQKREYSNAIEYLKKALIKEPINTSIRNNLAVALTARGTYLYNQKIDLEKAANDYRAAIYYLKFYNKSENTDTINENILIAEQNLNNVVLAQKTKTDSLSRLKKAKELRGQGNLIEAIVEYDFASKDRKYAYESFLALADIMKVLNNEYSAAVYYDKALAINSDDPYAHLNFGRTLYNLGNIDTAVRELDIASENIKTKTDALALLEVIWKTKVTQQPNDPIAQMNLGAVYQNKGNYTLAMSQYKNAQSIDPKNQMIKLNMATLLQQQGNYSEALSIYNNVLKNRPNDIYVNSYKASTLNKMGKVDEAILVYQNILNQNPQNEEIIKEMLAIINSLPEAQALNYLSKMVSKYQNNPFILYSYGYNLHRAKEYDKALNEYQKSLNIDSKNLDAYLNIAAIYKHQNNLAKAVETLEEAKIQYPQNTKITNTLTDYKSEFSYSLVDNAAEAYNNKEYEKALEIYKSIKNPTEDIFLGIGACYQALNNYDLAIDNYKKALALDASNPNSLYFLGLAYIYKKDFINAEKYLKKASELDEINPDIKDAYKTAKFSHSEQVMNEGIKLLDIQKIDLAISKLNEAITLCENNGYAFYYRGLAYDEKNNFKQALSDYENAIKLNPDLNIIYYSMALIYDRNNKLSEAKNMYEKYLSSAKEEDEYAKYAKQRLSELK